MSKILSRRFGGPSSPSPPPPVDGPAPDVAPGSPPASSAAVSAVTVMPGTSQWTLVNADGTAAAASPLKPDVDARKSPTKDKDKDKSPRTIMFKWKRGGHGDEGSDARLGAPTATSPKASHTDLGAKRLDDAKRKISMPFNFERRVHVDEQLQWTGGTEGRDPAELFKVEEKLGQGAFGSVYRAVLKETGFVLAVKEIALGSGQREAASQLAMIENEINVLRQCSHSNLVQYFGCCRRDHCLWILTDYCGGGSMSDVLVLLAEHLDIANAAVAANMASHIMTGGTDLHATMTTRTIVPGRFPGDATLVLDSRASAVCASGLTESEVAAVTAGALLGLVFLHGKGIIHRDLKSANILLSLAGDARIADFGVSEQLTTGAAARNTVVGTPFWMAPEVVLGTTYATPADIWSLAITVIELVDGVPPLHTEHPMRALFRIPHLPPPTTRHAAGPTIADFIAVAAVKDPAKRATAAQLVMHDLVAPYIVDPARRRAVLAPKVLAWKEARAMAAAAPVEETRKVNVDVASLAKASDAQRDRGEAVGVGEVSGTVVVHEDGSATVVVHDEEDAAGGEGYGTVVVHGNDNAVGTVVVHDNDAGTVVVHSDAAGTKLVHEAAKEDTKPATSTAAPPPLPPRPSTQAPTGPVSFLAPACELAARVLELVPWRELAHRVASLPIAEQMHDAWRRHVAPLIASGGAGGVRWSIHAVYWVAIAGVHWYYQGRIASG
ncbi:hypothetical protein GGF31_006260 [Allomyces arbusculus]|nr:hypothetical protein GGF31_006260 [Allomyces arbusculus]